MEIKEIKSENQKRQKSRGVRSGFINWRGISEGRETRAHGVLESTASHIAFKKVITLDAWDSIWKQEWTLLIESGDQTVASATVFSGQPPATSKNCRNANGHQMRRSIYQSKEEVMYITPIPCTSTLDPYKWRNQSWKYDGVHHELHVFAKLKAQIKCLYWEDFSQTKKHKK